MAVEKRLQSIGPDYSEFGKMAFQRTKALKFFSVSNKSMMATVTSDVEKPWPLSWQTRRRAVFGKMVR